MNVKRFLPKPPLRWKLISGFLAIALLLGVSLYTISFLKNSLRDFFLWKIESSGGIATINSFQVPDNLNPLRDWEVEELKIDAAAAIFVERSKDAKKALFSKNPYKRLPIASLTKLMTALIVLENYDLSQPVRISKEAVQQPGTQGSLKEGEILTVKQLLDIMLIESSNDAAFALSEIKGKKEFVDLMNLKAKGIGLKNTYFGNSTGLDPLYSTSTPSTIINYSTAEEIAGLAYYLLENYSEIWEILSIKESDLYTLDGKFHHKLENTNELLGEIPEIVGGKTGWTPRAGGCFLVVLKNQKADSFLIGVVLGTKDRFEEMKKIINWAKGAYKWQ